MWGNPWSVGEHFYEWNGFIVVQETMRTIFSCRAANARRTLNATLIGALFLALALTVLGATESRPGDVTAAEPASALVWTDVRQLGVEGQGWTDTKAPYDRLPAKAEGKVRAAVWNLSRHSAGLSVRFVTDAAEIHTRWVLTSRDLAMPHMAATGVSGLDLYVKTDRNQWRWLAVGKPGSQTNACRLVAGLPTGRREYLLYLPLYNGTREVELGVPAEKQLVKAGPWAAKARKPMVFYGTSILQGGCASRPGMVHSAILGRRFQFPHINLGFSGNGRMEPELADLLAELDPSVYVLDCLPNMEAAEVRERVEPFVRNLRAARPRTPIVLVEDRSYADSFLVASKRERNDTSRLALWTAFENLKKSGVNDLHYLKGADLLGDDGEGTVDSSHPNDLGFMRQADAFAKVLGPLLKRATRK